MNYQDPHSRPQDERFWDDRGQTPGWVRGQLPWAGLHTPNAEAGLDPINIA